MLLEKAQQLAKKIDNGKRKYTIFVDGDSITVCCGRGCPGADTALKAGAALGLRSFIDFHVVASSSKAKGAKVIKINGGVQ